MATSKPLKPCIDRIIEALEDGPLTVQEVAEITGIKEATVSATLRRYRLDRGPLLKRVYIKSWVRNFSGEGDYARCVYAIGDKRNEPKPPKLKVDNAARCTRIRNNAKARGVTSVFDLGRPVMELRIKAVKLTR